MGDRFKGYETAAEQVLPARLPIVLRLDGNSFSKLTDREEFDKPFDPQFEGAMNAAAMAVMDYCSGAQVAYVQSDEISILLRNDMTHRTQPFLANRTQKIASLCAATSAVAFNRENREHGIDTEAIFDCRAFVLPPEDVVNYFLWRQRDAFKNCISSFAYHELRKLRGRKTAQKMLHGKSTDERQELIFQELGVNPNDIPIHRKRGRCVYRENREVPLADTFDDPDRARMLYDAGHIDDLDRMVIRSFWEIDEEIPMFSSNRDYIGKYLVDEEEE
jgi:tRNA(His) 5'-end guanylyltransferase